MRITLLLILTLITAHAALADEVDKTDDEAEPATRPTQGEVIMEASMPPGFPAPDASGEVVLKSYPAYRAARTGAGAAFWRLFAHIQQNDVAMTAPVEMTLRDAQAEQPLQMTQMAFLYEGPSQGEVGDQGAVEVVDVPAMQVLSIGAFGEDNSLLRARMKAALDDALASDAFSHLEPAGAPRLLGYNSPQVPEARRFYELQLPVKPRDAAPADGADEAGSEGEAADALAS